MKLLAIESSALVASAAIVTEDAVLAEYSTDLIKTHSETLMPMIEAVCTMTQTDLSTIDAIAVSKGPGSFTGLRIGAATAKGLALALDKKIIPVSSLAAMAYNFAGSEQLIVPMMDARRDQVYTGIYCFSREYINNGFSECEAVTEDLNTLPSGRNRFELKLKCILDDGPMSISELMEKLNAIGEDVIFFGDGVPVFKEKIEELAAFPYCFAPVNLSRQKASGLAAYALYESDPQNAIDAAYFSPDYYRLSQAERERKERNGN